VRPGLAIDLISSADPALRVRTRIGSVSTAAGDAAGSVEARVRVPSEGGWRAGMTGQASVTLARSNVWGALWWAIRRRVRTDILL
jgi:hypothetical protein